MPGRTRGRPIIRPMRGVPVPAHGKADRRVAPIRRQPPRAVRTRRGQSGLSVRTQGFGVVQGSDTQALATTLEANIALLDALAGQDHLTQIVAEEKALLNKLIEERRQQETATDRQRHERFE